MKKSFMYYVICWISLVALFNIICFVTPDEINGLIKFAGAFWSGYGFIMLTFVGHLIYAWFALSTNNREKIILNTPIMVVSCGELALMVICGAICMIIPDLPNWVGIIVCSLILVFSIISLVLIKEVGENTSIANAKLNSDTGFYRVLMDNAQILVSIAKSSEVKKLSTSIYEAIRYSDPVSSEATYSLEREIETKLNQILDMIRNNETSDSIKPKVDELLLLIEVRNNKCKAQKRQRV